ncbi:GAF domain-containing protein [Kitasatospora sp. NPDC054795]
MRVLVSAAGTAVDNARLFEETRQGELWQQAHAAITTALLSGDRDQNPLHVVAEQARLVADADLAAIAVPGPGSHMVVVRAAAGAYADVLDGWQLPVGASQPGQVYRTGHPVITDDLATDARSYAPDPARPDSLGPGMIVPLTDTGRTEGVLFLTRARERPGFDPAQLGLLASPAFHSAVLERHFAQVCRDWALGFAAPDTFGAPAAGVAPGTVPEAHKDGPPEADVVVRGEACGGRSALLSVGLTRWNGVLDLPHLHEVQRIVASLPDLGEDVSRTRPALYGGAGFSPRLRSAEAHGELILVDLSRLYFGA